MLTESIFLRFFTKIFKLLNTYGYSKTCAVLNCMTKSIGNAFKGSIIYRFFKHEDNIQNYAKKSKILYFIDCIVVNIVGFFCKYYKILRKKNSGSINIKIFKYFNLKGYFKYEYILAFALVIMMIIPGHLWNNAYALLMALGLLLLYFLVLLSGRNFSYRLSKFDIILSVFMFSSVLAIFISQSVKDSLRVFIFFLISYIFLICISGSLKNTKSINTFIGILFVGVVLTSVYCIIQGIKGVDVDLRLTDVTANQGMPGRAYGTFENPNNFAEYLVLFFPFLLAFALNTKKLKTRIISFIFLLLPASALILTLSRSCWVSFALAVFIFICFYNYKLIPLIFIIGIALIPFLPEYVIKRALTIGSMNDTSNQYRLFIWEGVLRMLKNTWISGIGLGPVAFSKVYPSFARSNAILAPHSHMLFLEVLVEMGIMGFLSLITFWFMTIKRSITSLINDNPSSENRNIIIAGIASLTGIIFVSGVEYIWFYPRVMFSFFIIIGIILAALKVSKENVR